MIAWEPPHRFVLAWQVRPDWKFEPDLAKSSEVEVRFTPADDGTTLVELEHRGFERHGGNFAGMRGQVNSVGGWGTMWICLERRQRRRLECGISQKPCGGVSQWMVTVGWSVLLEKSRVRSTMPADLSFTGLNVKV